MAANIGATRLAQWLEVPAQYRFLRALVRAADFDNPRMPQSVGSGVPNSESEAAMLNKMTERLDFQSEALLLRAERQRAIASNIANADTPGYVARDFNFREALLAATSGPRPLAQASVTAAGHIPLQAQMSDEALKARLGYSVNSQPSLDNNTVDLDRERANFVDNSVRYEATLRFINGQAKTMLSAIQGQ